MASPKAMRLSFARLVYVSSWLKHYHPAIFAAALLNSQPMGFYAPAQIVRDAQENGVKVLAIDVNAQRLGQQHRRWRAAAGTAAGRMAFARNGRRRLWPSGLSSRSKIWPGAQPCLRARFICSPMPMRCGLWALTGAKGLGKRGGRLRINCLCLPLPTRANWGKKPMRNCPPCR